MGRGLTHLKSPVQRVPGLSVELGTSLSTWEQEERVWNVGQKGHVCGSLSPRPAGGHRQDGCLGASVVAPHCGVDLPGVPLHGNRVWGRNLGIHPVQRGLPNCPNQGVLGCSGWCFVFFCFVLVSIAINRKELIYANLSRSPEQSATGDRKIVSLNFSIRRAAKSHIS